MSRLNGWVIKLKSRWDVLAIEFSCYGIFLVSVLKLGSCEYLVYEFDIYGREFDCLMFLALESLWLSVMLLFLLDFVRLIDSVLLASSTLSSLPVLVIWIWCPQSGMYILLRVTIMAESGLIWLQDLVRLSWCRLWFCRAWL